MYLYYFFHYTFDLTVRADVTWHNSCWAEYRAEGRESAGITPQHTGQLGVSSQLLPCTPSLWCLPVMTPTFIIPVASSASSDISHQPWLLSSSVEEAQGGSGSALCMHGPGLLVIYRTMHEQGTADLAAPQPNSPGQQLTSHGICSLLHPPVLKLFQLLVWTVLKLPAFLFCWTSPLQVNPRRGILHSAPLKWKMFLLILLHLGPKMLACTDKDTLSW